MNKINKLEKELETINQELNKLDHARSKLQTIHRKEMNDFENTKQSKRNALYKEEKRITVELDTLRDQSIIDSLEYKNGFLIYLDNVTKIIKEKVIKIIAVNSHNSNHNTVVIEYVLNASKVYNLDIRMHSREAQKALFDKLNDLLIK